MPTTPAFKIPNKADALSRIQAEPDSGDFEIISRAFQGYGVVTGCDVSPSSGLTLAVAGGTIRLNTTTQTVTAGQTVTLTAAHATNPRLDLITVNSSGVVGKIDGTAAAAPTYPSLVGFEDRIVLAAVYVAALDSTIGSTEITDKRMILPTPGSGGGGGAGWTGVTGFIDVTEAPYNATGNGTTDDTAEIQAAIDASLPGDTIWFPHGTYLISAPLIVPAYRKLMGGGLMYANNATTNAEPQLKMKSGGTSATWGRKGMITHAYFTQNSQDQGPIWVQGLYINGNSQSVGNGVVVMGSCNVVTECLIDNFNGTTDFSSAAGSTSGSGYGVVWTTACFTNRAGTSPTTNNQGQNAVNSWFKKLRIGSNNNSIFVQKTVAGGITDYILEDIVCLKPPDYTHAKDDIRLEATGGAIVRHIHTNGSAGSGIHTVGSAVGFLRIVECYLDGWGCGNGSGAYGGIEIDQFTAFDGASGGSGGNGSPLAIDNIQCNVRPQSGGSAATMVVLIINMTNLAEVVVNNVSSHIQATTGSGAAFYFADITSSGSGGTCLMTNCLAQDQGDGAPGDINYTDARIFRSALTGVDLRTSNCSWMYGTAAPTNGNWKQGMRRINTNPSNGGVLEWVATTTGAPGSWGSLTLN